MEDNQNIFILGLILFFIADRNRVELNYLICPKNIFL